MSLYLIGLYLHITGAVGLFAGLGIEGVVYSGLKNAATIQQVLPLERFMLVIRKLYAFSVIFLLLSGIFLAEESWTWNPWIITGLVLLIALTGYGNVTGRKLGMSILSLDKTGKFIPDEIRKRISDPFIIKSYKVKVTLALGIIFMMTTKPGWIGCMVTVVAAFALGLLLDMPSRVKQEVKEPETV
jgi:uncharacterized membrane protein